ncbi:MAG TPA: hypothetical protein VHV83_19250 [Armatimonadota bacterium]|nr:hypothetical protein [Armatimonadota bacterium]
MAFYRLILSSALVAGMCLGSLNAYAGEEVGGRKIVDIGCHHVNGTCYVTLDGAAFGASLNCPSGPTNEFRFDDGDTAIGKRTFAALMAAYLSGKHVRVYLNGCTSQGAPAIWWFHVND